MHKQLPKNVRPRHYQIAFAPDLEAARFSGTAAIDVEIVERTDRIVVNAAELDISNVTLMRYGDTDHAQVSMDKQEQTATFLFPRLLPKGPATVHLIFAGTLNDKMHGFYRSEYMHDGKKHYMAVTQFEATDARRAFPCWDEPAIKATFSVSVAAPPPYQVITNTPLHYNTGQNEARQTIWYFEKTPVMSTYLLVIIVGEFESIGTQTKEGVQVNVFTRKGNAHRGDFALDVAAKTLSFFDEYFDIPYPLKKLDLLAIPDFAAGAMENWGAITYRETAILVDPNESSTATRQRVALTIAHEIAHQWFGNLVTMEWWTHLWLNEGFASWIEYLAVDHCFPEWKIWNHFLTADMGHALARDCWRNSHPIEVEVNDPTEIDEAFDAISYSKGAALIRMLAALLGADIFRKGLQIYLRRFQYGNAATEDLWRALSEASGQDVKAMMDAWTKQTGYPVIGVGYSEGTRNLAFAQSPFLGGGERQVISPEKERQWFVPISIRSNVCPKRTIMLPDTTSHAVDFPPLREYDWIKVNAEQIGFYRVNYQPDLLERLKPVIASSTLIPADRWGILNDAFALTRAGFTRTDQLLSLMKAYAQEDEHMIWADIAENAGELEMLFAGQPYYEAFRIFMRGLYRHIVEQVAWDVNPQDDHNRRLLRTLVLNEIGLYGDGKTIAYGMNRFNLLTKGEQLHPDLRAPVYNITAHSSDVLWKDIKAMHQRSVFPEEKNRCLRALGQSTNPDLLQQTLAYSLSSEVRAQDAVIGIMAVAENPHGRNLAWKFLQNNWQEIDRRYGTGHFLLPDLIDACASNFTSEEKAQEVEVFFQDHSAPAAARTIKLALERIRSNAQWLERDSRIIEQWFERGTGKNAD